MSFITTSNKDHKVLRTPARKIQFPLDQESQEIITTLEKEFYAADAAGLAAPQIGFDLSVIIFEVPEEAKQCRKFVYDVIPPTIFINPSYIPIESEGKYKDWEACFSVENYMAEVYRYNVVKYETFDLNGEKISGIARGFFAKVLQHEIDHLNGILYIDLLEDDCRRGTLDEMREIRLAEMNNLT